MCQKTVILGSASERRKIILSQLGIHFEVVIPKVEEVFYKKDPRRTASENALQKNRWCSRKYPNHRIITADTVIDFEDHCIAKPISMEEAFLFISKFSGKNQDVLTAVALSEKNKKTKIQVVRSTVKFKKLSNRQIKEYIAKVNPLDKAGAYDINQHGKIIIASYSGSFSNIMGLPKKTITQWLRQKNMSK